MRTFAAHSSTTTALSVDGCGGTTSRTLCTNCTGSYTEVLIPNDPASQIGVYLAGFAAAPGTGSPTDQHMVDRVLSQVPSPYRGHVLREGQKIANSGRSGIIQSYAKRLEQRGRL